MSYSEQQYNIFDDYQGRYGLFQLGPMSSFTYHRDPKRLLFVLSRYKFVAKLLSGSEQVLEVGCGDGFGSRLVRQHVGRLVVTDFDDRLIDHIRSQSAPPGLELVPTLWNPSREIGKFGLQFCGAYALDVLEHIPREDEDRFLESLVSVLKPDGCLVLGSPSLESQEYASPESRAGHVNCKTAEGLRELVKKYFKTIHCFSMNDELVHTGFSRMSHYNFVICHSPLRYG